MADWLAHEAIAPVLGAGIPGLREWGPLLAILVLFAIQTALAYRRGKVEPLPRGKRREPRPPVRIPEFRKGAPGTEAPETRKPESRGGEVSPGSGASLPRDGDAYVPQEEGPAFPVPELPSGSRSAAEARPSVAWVDRLRGPTGAREAFLGAEILWNPPVALRERDGAGL